MNKQEMWFGDMRHTLQINISVTSSQEHDNARCDNMQFPDLISTEDKCVKKKPQTNKNIFPNDVSKGRQQYKQKF